MTLMWRTFDVGGVVDSLVGDSVTIAAGRGGMNRAVRRARMIDGAEDLRRSGNQELVIVAESTLLAVSSDLDRVMADLNAMGVAGLVVRLEGDAPLSAKLVAAADRAGIPVIVIDGTATLTEVTTIVLDALLSAQGHRLERFLEIHQRFTPVVLSGGGTAEIASTLHSVLRCPIVVLDSGGNPIASVPGGADPASVQASDVRQPILAGEHRYGEIVVLNNGGRIADDHLLALERASTAIAVRLAHSSAVGAEYERFAATTLEELIAGHGIDATSAAERAISLGWDLSRPRAVLLASIDPPTDRAVVPSALATIAAAARATLGPDAIVWTRSTTIAALVAPATAAPGERRRIAEALRRELDLRLRAVMVSIGVGRRVNDASGLPNSYIEASRAVDVGRWAKGRHVTEVYDELGLERLLASTPTDDLAEFVEQAIGGLVDHDRVHRSDLVATLAVWLETRNMAEASRRVHVHYNTFKNRLDRIEKIVGPFADDPVLALECEIAIYISRHYDGPWSSIE